MATVKPAAGQYFTASVPVLIVGAGACGLTAALACRDAGVEVVLLERDSLATGSTSLTSGMIPACRTAQQAHAGVEDCVALMMADINKKCANQAPAELVEAICAQSGPTIGWLTEEHGIALQLVNDFLYPGHSVARMHAPASRAGADLQAALLQASERSGATLMTDAWVTTLFVAEEGTVKGVRIARPDGTGEAIGCGALILACNGFGGNPAMVAQYIPAMAGAEYFGHRGNQGEAVQWGHALGAATRCMGAYQGHGSVATPHQILVTWALMMEGGIQVNAHGERFSNEHDGYSEQAVRVLDQPGGIAWCVYDGRRHQLGGQFEDYRSACERGAVLQAADTERLAAQMAVPHAALAASIAMTQGERRCPFGRSFTAPALAAPYHAIKVTGALLHTQGGLAVSTKGQVLTDTGKPLPNLYAGGGAAGGLSGEHVWGYLSGNGLLSAVVLGRIAGQAAAYKQCSESQLHTVRMMQRG